jgi:hypothetical protein
MRNKGGWDGGNERYWSWTMVIDVLLSLSCQTSCINSISFSACSIVIGLTNHGPRPLPIICHDPHPSYFSLHTIFSERDHYHKIYNTLQVVFVLQIQKLNFRKFKYMTYKPSGHFWPLKAKKMGKGRPKKGHLRPNSWTKSRQKSKEFSS